VVIRGFLDIYPGQNGLSLSANLLSGYATNQDLGIASFPFQLEKSSDEVEDVKDDIAPSTRMEAIDPLASRLTP
jgi:hypothetical protein